MKIKSIFVIAILLLTTVSISHAAETVHSNIYVCVVPGPNSAEDDNSSIAPYVMVFRDTNLFGFILPQDAEVTLYNTQENTEATLYSISTDAQTGGYRRQEKEANVSVQRGIPGDRPCTNEYPDIVTPDLARSVSLPVSPDHALLVQAYSSNTPSLNTDCQVPGQTDRLNLDCLPFLGVASLQFRPESNAFKRDIQIIQLVAQSIDVAFPHLSTQPTVRFALVANKEVTLKRSFHSDSPFLSRVGSNPRTDFLDELSAESLDLFTLLDEAKAHLYPAYGMIYDYPTDGFLRIDMDSGQSSRIINVGDPIASFKADQVSYEAYGHPEQTGHLDNGKPKFVRFDDATGEMIVKFANGPELSVLEPWFADVQAAP